MNDSTANKTPENQTDSLGSTLPRLVKRYRTDDRPHASDGLEIDLGSGKIRIGIHARRLAQLPTFFSNYALRSDWNIRIGRVGIAFKSSSPNVESRHAEKDARI